MRLAPDLLDAYERDMCMGDLRVAITSLRWSSDEELAAALDLGLGFLTGVDPRILAVLPERDPCGTWSCWPGDGPTSCARSCVPNRSDVRSAPAGAGAAGAGGGESPCCAGRRTSGGSTSPS